MPEILIRPARPGDKAAVMNISSTVWDGSDYLPSVWDAWVAEDATAGFLLAGELDGQVIAIQHTSLQAGRVAWMEGIRVDPAYRNRGIGRQMLARALQIARERGCTRARLSTVRSNRASTAIAESHGFREIAEFVIFSAPASEWNSSLDSRSSGGNPGGPSNSRESAQVTWDRVSPADIQELREYAGDPDTLIVNQWTAYVVPGQLSPEDFPIRRVCRSKSRIEGIALAEYSRSGRDLSVAYLGGTRQAVTELAQTLRIEAGRTGLESVFGMFADTPNRYAGLADAGYKRNEDLVVVIFEREL